MKQKKTKYTYLTDYQIESINKEKCSKALKEKLLNRINVYERDKRRSHWDQMHCGPINLITYKNGKEVNRLELNEDDTPDGFSFIDIKSISNDISKLFQDYESHIETVLILKDIWDEREDTEENSKNINQ